MGDKLLNVTRLDSPSEKMLMFWCPGCKSPHKIRVGGKQPVWDWNGSIDKPSFSPSLLTEKDTPRQCHMVIKDGKIEFCHDCCHALAGTAVDLPDLTTWR